MWFECLPSIGVVAACLAIAPYGSLFINYFLLNKHVRNVTILHCLLTDVGASL